MPAIFHLVAHAMLGSLLAWCSRAAPRGQQRLLGWPLLVGLAYAAGILLPVAAFQFRFYPDFSLSYAFDPVLYPWVENRVGWLGLSACIANVAALVVGYAVTRAGVRAGRWTVVFVVPVGSVATAVWAALHFGPANLALGDYGAYWRGQAVPWTSTASGVVVALAYTSALVALRYGEGHWRGRDPALLGRL